MTGINVLIALLLLVDTLYNSQESVFIAVIICTNINVPTMKTKYLTIRISEDEKKRIKADAVKVGLSLTDYVLSRLNAPPKHIAGLDYTKLRKEFKVFLESIDQEEFNNWLKREREKNVPTIVPTQENVPTKPTERAKLKKIVEVMTDNTELDTPTIEKLVKAGKQAKKPSYYVMAENVRTKMPVNIKSTEKVSIEYAGEKPVSLCAICHDKIKKGFLCADCLK